MLIDINNPPQKYGIIYADPPWQYNAKRKGKHGCADTHYTVMTPKQLKALPVQGLAAENCTLFLWTTYPCLPQALTLMQVWGFEYKTVAFTWVKRNRKSDSLFFGLGHYTRSNAEIVLLGTCGRPKRVSASVPSMIVSPVAEHSAKPDAARERIVWLMGDLPRIELFARGFVDGWDVWGDEAQ